MTGSSDPLATAAPHAHSTHGRELAALKTFNATLAGGASFRVAAGRALGRAAEDYEWHAVSIHLLRGDDVIAEVANVGAMVDAIARLHRIRRARDRRSPAFGVQRDGRSRRDAVALPLEAAGRVVGVLDIVWRVPGDSIPSQQFPFIETLAVQLAAWVDRALLIEELESRLSETAIIRKQLEAYALDVRETFAAEKQRAEQLAGALDELERTYLATVSGLAIAVEAKDETTGGHLVRVARIGRALVRSLDPSKEHDRQLEYGFLLHDIGKLTVPDAILRKQGPLTEQEWAVMRQHPMEGDRILRDIPFLLGAREIVRAHHERWDGLGYPLGLRGDEIPFGARLFPVADALDAMTSARPYRPAMGLDEAFAELQRAAGTQFWDEAVEALRAIPRDELAAILGKEIDDGA